MARKPKNLERAEDSVVLRSVVLCDQVRTEDNGKHLLIGVYDAGMSTDTVPALFSGACFGVFELVRDDVRILEYRINSPGAVGMGRVEFNADAAEWTAIPFVAPFSFVWDRKGEISLDWRADGSNWSRPVKWGLNVELDARRLPEEQAERMRRFLEDSPKAANEAEAVDSEAAQQKNVPPG